jgi:hypothetical protein
MLDHGSRRRALGMDVVVLELRETGDIAPAIALKGLAQGLWEEQYRTMRSKDRVRKLDSAFGRRPIGSSTPLISRRKCSGGECLSMSSTGRKIRRPCRLGNEGVRTFPAVAPRWQTVRWPGLTGTYMTARKPNAHR